MTDKAKEKQSSDAKDDARKEEIANTLCIASGLMMTAVTMVVPTRAPMVKEIKKGDAAATARAMGLMTAFAGVLELVLNPVLGKLSDEYGRKPFLLLAPTVNAVLHSLVAAFPSTLAMQFMDRMISGMFIFGFLAPAQAAMADLYATNPQRLGIKAANAGAYFGIGCALGPFIGSKLGGAKSFFASAVAFVITWCYVKAKFTETLEDDRKKKFKFSDINPVAFLKLFKTKTLAWLVSAKALQSFGDYVNVYDINNLFMMTVLGYDQPQIGNFATTVGVSQIASGYVSSRMIKQVGLVKSTVTMNLMWILGMAMMGTSRNTAQAFTALAIWTFGHQRATPVDTYLQKYGAQQDMGRAEIVGAAGNMLAYAKIMIPLLYSNVFAWATSNGRNMPGLPYFVICAITGLAQGAFSQAQVKDD
jgi:DHA1 family tetracycline resistance protein-like MFS transporter